MHYASVASAFAYVFHDQATRSPSRPTNGGKRNKNTKTGTDSFYGSPPAFLLRARSKVLKPDPGHVSWKYTVPLATPKSLFDILLRTRKIMGTFFSYHTSSYRAAMKRSSKKNTVLGWAAIVESVNHGLRKEFVWTSHKPQSATTRSENAVSHTTPDRGVRTGWSYL